MKLLAICAGRKMGNSEIVVKEVLMTAEDLGAEVRMINLSDFVINPCTGCENCVMMISKGKKPKCVHEDKDDYDRIMKAMWDSDGVIYGVPTYELQTPGLFKLFANRFLPYDPAFLHAANIIDRIPERVGAIIATGGSTQAWMTMTLPGLYISMWVHCIKVVDQLMVTGVGRPGHAVLKKDALLKAKKMGENIVQAMSMPLNDVTWLGEDKGWCPICHSNLILKGKPHWDGECYQVECAVCGAGGHLKEESGDYLFIVDERSLRKNRLKREGQIEHLGEIQNHMKEFFSSTNEVQEKIKKYKTYLVSGID